ncbi:GNAT family N-acetyltransferase [Salininema proteolyticum]|uniref:GNAT family N-acetyltransferase n=1 Tax=Salininema proteolyticum TaxID=1607685 RepID=A0ABV8TZP6_9ACTN
MRLHTVAPDDREKLDRVHRLLDRARAHDHPTAPARSPRELLSLAAAPGPNGETQFTALGDDPVAVAETLFFPGTNSHMAHLRIAVDPEQRHLGHGTALYRSAMKELAAEGRREVIAGVRLPSEAGTAFAEGRGFTVAVVNRARRCDAHGLTDGELREFENPAGSADYEIRAWTGPTPPHDLPLVAALDAAANALIPQGDLTFQAGEADAEALACEEEKLLSTGAGMVQALAVHRPTGEPAAWTRMDLPPDAAHAYQGMTLVAPGHRGHRLGLTVKAAALLRLRASANGVRWIWTSNAEENSPMAAINERLGYRPAGRTAMYRKVL